jgi:hypothetical protein
MSRDPGASLTDPADGSWCTVPVQAVTGGAEGTEGTGDAGHYFFGYYDKTCWDGSGRHVLCRLSP